MTKEIRVGELSVYVVPFLISLLVPVACFLASRHGVDIVQFYGDKMRASLFSGFLTLGSFLLALKTGIVIKIKEGVYDKKEYQAKILNAQELQGKEIYGPLRRLSRLLSTAVFSALTSSGCQLTIGLLSYWWAVSIALTVATFALLTLMASFILIQINLSKWFDLMEESVEVAKPDISIPAKHL